MSIAHAMKTLYDSGLTSIYDGNISFKEKDGQFFMITPGSVRKHTIVEKDLVKITIDSGNVIVPEHGKPSKELPLHSMLQLNCENNLYVVHCHPPDVLSFIHNGRELFEILNEFPELDYKIGKNVNYYMAGSDSLAKETFDNILNNDIVALERHGVVAKGPDLQSVLDTIEVVNYYCKVYNNSYKSADKIVRDFFKNVFGKVYAKLCSSF